MSVNSTDGLRRGERIYPDGEVEHAPIRTHGPFARGGDTIESMNPSEREEDSFGFIYSVLNAASSCMHGIKRAVVDSIAYIWNRVTGRAVIEPASEGAHLLAADILSSKKRIIQTEGVSEGEKFVAFFEMLSLEEDSSLTKSDLQAELYATFASENLSENLKRIFVYLDLARIGAAGHYELLSLDDIRFPEAFLHCKESIQFYDDRIFRSHTESFLNGSLPLSERLAHLVLSMFIGKEVFVQSRNEEDYETLTYDRENYRARIQEFLASNPVNEAGRRLSELIDSSMDPQDCMGVLSEMVRNYPSAAISLIRLACEECKGWETMLHYECFNVDIFASICPEEVSVFETNLTTDTKRRQALKDCLLMQEVPDIVSIGFFEAVYNEYLGYNDRLSDWEKAAIARESFRRAPLDSELFHGVLEILRRD